MMDAHTESLHSHGCPHEGTPTNQLAARCIFLGTATFNCLVQ